ncbi:MAG: hypothetical protein M3430_22870 [Acidobacteriota bacterium]|nr:hypothetical protein [Acidobacteriota bacterium]
MVTDDKEYEFRATKAELLHSLSNQIGLRNVHHYRFDDDFVETVSRTSKTPMSEEDRNIYSFNTPSKFCNDDIRVTVTLHGRGDKTVLKLGHLIYNCDVESQQHDSEAIRIFEQDVIDKLRVVTTNTTPN